jgi:hypothetical protein
MTAPGLAYQITQRGNGRHGMFFSEDDYQAHLDLMAEWCTACNPVREEPAADISPQARPQTTFCPEISMASPELIRGSDSSGLHG